MAAARWRLAGAGRAEHEEVGALLEPAVAGGERHDLGLGDHRHGVEVEAVEGLAGRQPRLGQMALDAAAGAFGELVLGQGGEEAGGGPALLVGALGEARPDVRDAGQAQLGEQEAEAGRRRSGSVAVMPALPRRRAAVRHVVGAERGQRDGDLRQGLGVRGEAGAQLGEVRQLAGVEAGVDQRRRDRPRSPARGRAPARRP